MENNNNETKRISEPFSEQSQNVVVLPNGRTPVRLGSGVTTRVLGEGGMANVYEIWNSQLEVYRAVKLLRPNCNDEARERFQTEIKITAKLHHPNIIEIHSVNTWNGLPFIEMEKIDGYTLETLINERGALPLTVVLAVGIMISRSLEYAHNQEYVIYGTKYHGVIHRDIKPSNIMICKNGVVKLMDFGIARPTDASIHTTDGSILGTMQYLSPEQLDGKDPDIRTDIYSLGTTLYEAITGKQAFPEKNVSRLMLNKLKNEYKDLSLYRTNVPTKLRKIIYKSMMYNREKRIQNASIFLSELEKLYKTLTTDTPEQSIVKMLKTKPKKNVIKINKQFPWEILFIIALLITIGVSTPIFMANYNRNKLKKNNTSEQYTLKLAVEETTPVVKKQTPKTSKKVKKFKENIKKVNHSTKKNNSVKSPVKKTVPHTKSFITQLIEKYGTSDLLEIMVLEVNNKNYKNAIKVFNKLSAKQSKTSKAIIYKLRALQKLKDNKKIENLLKTCNVNDAEIYLAKGELAYSKGQIDNAIKMFDIAIKSPRQFITSNKLNQEVYYYKALCATKEFDKNPNEKMYKKALDLWWQVKNQMRTSPDHFYNRTALIETQRIAKKFRNSQKR